MINGVNISEQVASRRDATVSSQKSAVLETGASHTIVMF